ncbi:LLM class flavin-dependent oxidoreductase [Pseudooceanicola sp. CBS1P-1]|uniref:NtaA/DmoA family FMN-dependent monooxygenase n=1 Tax=Pseudooceanicola albus TaxID=2692189 RepID=A0A6L7GAX6_9RHOB|nr:MULTISPECIES: LLM class flavin-dependent oxidoreductase [Pseudooceanicola]MBT9386572.1 LLM class flavin-dependent oxidoreductase [Pseudooceanicola endophyticus]MXN20688.1 NtaA/DmoA family FMN-dependent monooxygenase [Pseudooceanicola albus]
MTNPKRQMKMGVSMHVMGYHPGSWTMPGVNPNGLMELKHFAHVAQTAERGLFDMMFLADHAASRNLANLKLARENHHNNVKLEPLMLLSALATMTSHVGLVSTVNATYNAPYTIARILASVDHISKGRMGWNFVTGFCPDEARNYGYDGLPDQVLRKERGQEFVDIVQALMDSWEDDAMIRDKETGIFFDRDKVHFINYAGEHLKSRGPLDICRPPQGQIPMVMAGDSLSTKTLAAKRADVLYSAKSTFELARDYYAEVKGLMAGFGRDPEALKIMPGMMVFVAKTESEAREKLERITATTPVQVGLSEMLPYYDDPFGMDLNAPAPEIVLDAAQSPKGPLHNSGGTHSGAALQSAVDRINAVIRDRKPTLAELARLMPSLGVWKVVVGTPAQVADEMEHWFLNGAADGFNLQPPYMPAGLEDFVDLVVPELQRRGLYRSSYEGTTLRDNLGIKRPADRWAA